MSVSNAQCPDSSNFKPPQLQIDSSSIRQCLLFYGLAFLATWLVKDHVFFWDTVQLGAKHAHWYYENNFQFFLLPQAIDSGHPPTFGMYLALCWKWFGKTLAVSHFAMLPFTFCSIFYLQRIGSYFLGSKHRVWLLPLLFVDPTFAAQSLLVSPDVVLFSFFLMGFWATLTNRLGLLMLATIGLAAISMRGMMVAAFLYVAWVISSILFIEKQFSLLQALQKMIPFLPSGLLALAFLGYHHNQTGWIGYHPDSPWAASFERVDAMGFLKNSMVYVWRLLDFGRIFVLLALGWLAFRIVRSGSKLEVISKQLLVYLVFSMLLLSPTLLIYKGLLGHRYFLPIYFLFSLSTLHFLFAFTSLKRKTLFAFVLTLLLASGNLWIYPKTIAQAWDSTLAHLPYYKLREKMLDYIDQQQIPYQQIGTVFPEIGLLKFKLLDTDTNAFVRADLSTNDYIFYASVMNDFPDETLHTLERQWAVQQRFTHWGLEVVLYSKKDN